MTISLFPLANFDKRNSSLKSTAFLSKSALTVAELSPVPLLNVQRLLELVIAFIDNLKTNIKLNYI